MQCTCKGCKKEVEKPLTIRLNQENVKYDWCNDHIELVKKRCPLLIGNQQDVLFQSRQEITPFYALAILATVILFVLAILHINSHLLVSIILGLNAIVIFIFLYKLEMIFRKQRSFEDACIDRELRDLEELMSSASSQPEKTELESVDHPSEHEIKMTNETIKREQAKAAGTAGCG